MRAFISKRRHPGGSTPPKGTPWHSRTTAQAWWRAGSGPAFALPLQASRHRDDDTVLSQSGPWCHPNRAWAQTPQGQGGSGQRTQGLPALPGPNQCREPSDSWLGRTMERQMGAGPVLACAGQGQGPHTAPHGRPTHSALGQKSVDSVRRSRPCYVSPESCVPMLLSSESQPRSRSSPAPACGLRFCPKGKLRLCLSPPRLQSTPGPPATPGPHTEPWSRPGHLVSGQASRRFPGVAPGF